ncbi:hypothetical protein GCM10011363_07740 [Marivita lacus]|jgi:hypothetical protein|uniref:Uncharacterized protein n=1 Tax=Marivita lacus TaxID=1323742 RepID=A0ABQ1KEY7_9RHOB|nr:hypothetical protein GCM10011363_07740 [Marivita lacus]
MKTDNILYIAETDESGQVVCVWCTDANRSRPKPLRLPLKHRPEIKPSQCSGTTPSNLIKWMQDHAT